jgi:hypothetical protein
MRRHALRTWTRFLRTRHGIPILVSDEGSDTKPLAAFRARHHRRPQADQVPPRQQWQVPTLFACGTRISVSASILSEPSGRRRVCLSRLADDRARTAGRRLLGSGSNPTPRSSFQMEAVTAATVRHRQPDPAGLSASTQREFLRWREAPLANAAFHRINSTSMVPSEAGTCGLLPRKIPC